MDKLFRGFTRKTIYALLGSGIVLMFTSVLETLKDASERTISPNALMAIGVGTLIFGFVAKYFYMDPKKMELDFYTPDSELHEKICRECAQIRYELKNGERYAAMVVVFMLVAYISMAIYMSSLEEISSAKAFLGGLFAWCLIPGFIAAIPTSFIWNYIYNKKMARIANGEYLVAEAMVTESYRIRVPNKRRISYKYFVMLEDCFGVKGNFVISEEYYSAMDAGDTVLLVKPEQGGMFRNHMEPIIIW